MMSLLNVELINFCISDFKLATMALGNYILCNRSAIQSAQTFTTATNASDLQKVVADWSSRFNGKHYSDKQKQLRAFEETSLQRQAQQLQAKETHSPGTSSCMEKSGSTFECGTEHSNTTADAGQGISCGYQARIQPGISTRSRSCSTDSSRRI